MDEERTNLSNASKSRIFARDIILLRNFQTTSHPQKGVECTQKGVDLVVGLIPLRFGDRDRTVGNIDLGRWLGG